MPGDSITWRQSGASVVDAAQTNIANSLGGNRSSTTLWDSAFGGLQSTFTAASSGTGNRHRLEDSTRSGDSSQEHRGKYLAILTGTAAPFVSRIIAFDVSGGVGVFILDDQAPADVGIGDFYRVFGGPNIFADVSAVEARAGLVDYKMIYAFNGTGSAFTATEFLVDAVNPAGTTLELVASLSGQPHIQITLSDRFDDPTNQWNKVDPDPGNEFNDDKGLHGHLLALGDPDVSSWGTGSSVALFLRRTIPAGTRKRTAVAWVIRLVTDLTGSDPDPMISELPIVFDVAGEDPVIDFSPDRFPVIRGGARLEGRVTDATSGLAIADRATEFVADVGTIVDPTADRVTDANGEVAATYTSPTNPALEGTAVNFTMKIGGGDEV